MTDDRASGETSEPGPWPLELDALVAAPDSHRVVFENDRVRVLEVVIQAHAREPQHVHRAAGVMVVDRPARIRYYVDGTARWETPPGASRPDTAVSWMEPEGPHAVENLDERAYHAVRIELK